MRAPKARPISAALLLSVIVAACGSTPSSPSASVPGAPPTTASPATESPAPGTSPNPSRPIEAGTRCGATSAFSGSSSSATSPAPAGGQPPTWSVRAASAALASVAVSPDGELLAIAGPPDGSKVAQLMAADGSKAASLAQGDSVITCLAWSPDSSLLAGASQSGDIGIWDRQAQLVRTVQGTDPIFSLAWSPDGSALAVGAVHFPAPTASVNVPIPGVIRVWNREGHLIRTLGTQLTGGKFLNLAWSPDGSMLAAGAVDYAVWRTDGIQVGVPRTAGTPAWAMAWSPDGRALAIGDENGSLLIAGPDGAEKSLGSVAGGVDALSYSPDGASLAVGHGSAVSVVDAADGKTVRWSASANAAYSIWSTDGRNLLISANHGLVVLDASTGKASRTLIGCSGRISAFSWDGSVAIAVTDSGWLCSWRSPGS